jgi:hypothetical protein
VAVLLLPAVLLMSAFSPRPGGIFHPANATVADDSF